MHPVVGFLLTIAPIFGLAVAIFLFLVKQMDRE